ncbi:hypothetical protein K7W42_05940 [Deinococcus sp. HMF7604]|uniref:DUF6882 domain-containing protein n=1 Tax=Deinococcus betulae TaxID=2873312 RepID=UPI001CC9AB62|nr:DUF6882 domain-containing protein [Deinococcus betulae]MBZ9750399.1 hypothetical protein [Deinococcus betulae]
MTNVNPALFGDQSAVVERALAGLQAQTAAHDGAWGLGRADWQADLQAGTLTFTNETFRATCPVQVVGTYNTQDGPWLWGWDHPSVPAELTRAAGKVRAFAQEHRLHALTTRTLSCTEEDAWHLTALDGAQGAYRGPAGPTLVFMTFGEVALTSAGQG